MEVRVSICALVDNPGEVDEAESWLERHRESLTFVSDMNGCGCCVVCWDIEGPKAIVDTLPMHLSAASSWASDPT